MQGLHHQQQQLAALLAAALSKDDSPTSTPAPPTTSTHPSSSSSSSSTAAALPSSEDNHDTSRVAAITSLHRAICYPPNSVLITHFASFLAQGFSQLLSDKSFLVRQEAATAYGALCSLLCSIPMGSNPRKNLVLNSLVDQFINWALQLLRNLKEGTSEIALEALREFLSVGDVNAVDRYALSILKACQELLEDERTTLTLLHNLLSVLTLISLKFFRSFQPHFVDIVDLLLGWAMVPDLAESDKRVIMDSFLQFQKHWVNNMQFSLNLLSKFLGDMEVLLQDGSPSTPQLFRRLLVLLSCFSTVLQSVASGLLEINLLIQIIDPLCKMIPRLLNCLSLIGKKFGLSTWIEDSWKCLTLLAEILGENFSQFYPLALDILFQSLETESKFTVNKITTLQVHGVLKTNLHLLSLQKLGFLSSYVCKILRFDAPISRARLNPNHLVTGSSAATYVFLLQHVKNDVVEKTMIFLLDELESLKNMFGNDNISKGYSNSEVIALIKFNFKVLLTCVPLGGENSLVRLYVNRSEKLVSCITDKLNPFELPIQRCVELQVTVLNTLEKLSRVELLSKWSIMKESEKILEDSVSEMFFETLRKYVALLVRALHNSSPLSVKIEALQWIYKICENFIEINQHFKASCYVDMNQELLFSILSVSFDRESKVRMLVGSVLEMLMRGKLIHPSHFPVICEIVLEKLGDPEKDVKAMFVKLLSDVLPLTVYMWGLHEVNISKFPEGSNLQWKQLFAVGKLPQQLHSQQLVSIMSYISQRWKVPLSSWIHRLIQTCKRSNDNNDLTLTHSKEGQNGLYILEKVSSVNILSGAWWAVHEAARYCITTRLRTNLGGPTQTFAALERMLFDIAHVLHLDTEQNNDGNLKIISSSYAHLLPMRLLLDFVEALKKNVYNAYEGSMVLPSTSRTSSLFFRANKKVCVEWFSRICEPMMKAGLALQCHDATIHYCTLRLLEISNHFSSKTDLMRVLRYMGLALCKNHEHEALFGLRKWAFSTFTPLLQDENSNPGHFTWIDGLVYQAKGEHEKAAACFIHLLQNEESLTSMGSDGVQFLISRIIENYSAVSDWKSLDSWLLELQTLRSKYAGKSYSGALTTTGNEVSSIQALAHFDEGDYQASWACLDLTPKSSNELTLDPKLALQRSEQMLLQAMLLEKSGKVDEISRELEKGKSMLSEILTVLPLDGIVEAAPYVNQLCCILAFEESGPTRQDKLLASYIQALQSPINKVRQDCNMWLKVFRVFQTTSPESPLTLNLCNNILILARKQRNLRLAGRLFNYLKEHSDVITSNLQYEGILLMHAENKLEDALMNLWSYVRDYMVSSLSVNSDSPDNLFKAKGCLKLSKWLRKDYEGLHFENIVLKMKSDFKMIESTPSVNLIVEELVGSARKLSSLLGPNMGKSWFLYASWCYDQAKASISMSSSHEVALHSCSLSSILASEIYPERFSLSDEERLEVKHILSRLPQSRNLLEDNELSSHGKVILQLVINIIEALASIPGMEDSSSQNLSSTVTSELQKCFISQNITLDEAITLPIVNDLVNIWWGLRKRRVSLFGHAAQAFIKYLSCSSSKSYDGKLSSWVSESKYESVGYTLRATLYVLDILLNYGVELQDILEPALSTVPLLPWQAITPQLFSRLSSHSEKVVRKQLENLLVMLAKQSPWSIVYPTLVDANSYGKEPSEELQLVLACLNKLHPRLVQDVQLMIKELNNVTVLWEELWLSTLQDVHADVMRRINLLKEEATRVSENTTLTPTEKNKINAAKYSAMMAPIIVVLERRLISTSRKPETPHEKWFHDEFNKQIKTAISNFKTPPSSATSLGDVWRRFDHIASSLASHQRKSSLSLHEVSPELAILSSSHAPMPGLDILSNVTIASFDKEVTVLSTKTKPKKIHLFGSDGKKYTYLLKGREDLRLDARIMQLLQAVNSFLGSFGNIRYYSVTPISGQAGLIQWVDNVTSIYTVFKSWQIRVQLAQGGGNNNNNTNEMDMPAVPRPTDMFYGKIIPALKEKGIRRVISRRDWPQEVKRKVLLDLMNEAPKELLYQELWCASEGFKAFSSKLKRYSSTLAAMSMVGHVLGLGDRHLDNILIDFSTGDILHIDYNVCFDKGKRLKVPEIVPFRLTQTVESALGITGIEGTFRAYCEQVLGVLKKNKDTILLLLEAFVWDPLVEWTRGDFHDDAAIVGEERKGMELAVSLSLFASRVQEIRVPLQEHHDLLLTSLPAAESALETFEKILDQYKIVATKFHHADQERSNLAIHETSAKSIVSEATLNSDNIRSSLEIQAHEFTQAQTIAMENLQELTNWIEQHERVLEAIRSSSFSEMKVDFKFSDEKEALSVTHAVIVARVPLTVVPEPTLVQCHDIDREVEQIVTELDHGIDELVAALRVYSLALQRVLPGNYVTTSCVHSWEKVLQLSVSSLSSDIISLARRQGSELLLRKENFDSTKRKYDSLCVRLGKYATEVERVEKEYSELVNSIGLESELKAKERLVSEFTHEGNKESVVSILNSAISNIYSDVKHKLTGRNVETNYSEVEAQIEKCFLVAGFLNEVSGPTDDDQGNWVSIFKECLVSCENLVEQMIEIVLPEVIKSYVSYNSEIMDVSGSVSQIKGSIDTALEQLFEVEMEKASLIEFEQSYFVKVGLVTEKQLALEEASIKGRDNLSWEEAEELASQEDACKAQLDKLHKTWNQKDIRTSSLLKKESSIKSSLVSLEHYMKSLTIFDQTEQPHMLRSKSLLASLNQPFSELESFDRNIESVPCTFTQLANSPISHYVWNLPRNVFFIWKVSVIDSFLDSCTHDSTKKKLEPVLKEHIEQYLIQRVLPVFIRRLDEESQISESKMDETRIKKAQLLLENYCNAHESVRSGKLAASIMKRRVDELKEALLKTSFEIIQMEWMNDITSSQNNRLISHKFHANEDEFIPILMNINRGKLLESIRSYIAKVSKLLEGLLVCERNSVVAEGQLERAMSWACGGPSSSNTSGIPQEYHDHLVKRRQHLHECREKASDIMNVCISVVEFEASRDGIFPSQGDSWQEVYLNLIMKLEVTYHSFTRTEQEWKRAQSNVEAASSALFTASNELSIASVKAQSASGELQNTLVAMRDCAYDTSAVLSTFGGISKNHTALTIECGSMLEEVLAITEGLHDVHNLGKEAASLHSSLMENLTKANACLLPLESVLSKDISAINEAMGSNTKNEVELSPVHGQAIYQSYHTRILDSRQAFKPLVSPLISSVKGLHSLLTKLARTASLHAGNLHKALEGLGESEEERSQDTNPSRSDLNDHDDEEESEIIIKSDGENEEDFLNHVGPTSQDKGWLSPPESITSCSSDSDFTSTSSNGLDIADPILKSSSDGLSSTETNLDSRNLLENSDVKSVHRIDTCLSSEDKITDESRETLLSNVEATSRKGKNAYAMSILRRVEMKIDGRDISENRDISVSEQVDFLLKQATSLDNLCNMYEGWTPWI